MCSLLLSLFPGPFTDRTGKYHTYAHLYLYLNSVLSYQSIRNHEIILISPVPFHSINSIFSLSIFKVTFSDNEEPGSYCPPHIYLLDKSCFCTFGHWELHAHLVYSCPFEGSFLLKGDPFIGK